MESRSPRLSSKGGNKKELSNVEIHNWFIMNVHIKLWHPVCMAFACKNSYTPTVFVESIQFSWH